MKMIIFALLTIVLFDCSKNEEPKGSKEIVEKNILTTNSSFSEWWDFNYKSIPSFSDDEYMSKYDMKTLLKYYKILEIEYFNEPQSGRNYPVEKELAEKVNIHFQFFVNLNYYGNTYYEYLCNFTKKYFENNNIGIKPDYYSPISSTAFIGLHTFNCKLVIGKCKNDKDIQKAIDEKLEYLKMNLPAIISGFRVFSVEYNCEQTGTSGSLGLGYIWKRDGDLLIKKEEGLETWGSEIPERTMHWNQDSWNDGKALINNYSIE